MERPRLERLTEAYEVLWNECRLEAFLHRHPSTSTISNEIEDDSSTGDESESATKSSDNSSTTNGNEGFNSPPNEDLSESGPDGDGWLAGWTNAELALLFPSLARRSKWFPDLIAQDLGFSKSPSQISHLLSLLRQQSDLNKKVNRTNVEAHSKAERKSRRIGRMPGAYEVSEEWLNLEETLAIRLQKWQDMQDVEVGVEKQTKRPGHETEELAETDDEKQEDEVTNSRIVSWDTQVINALLFLRHCPGCNPDSDAANFIYNVPLSAWSGESELKLFSFSASLAIDLFTNKKLTKRKDILAYKDFSRVHPTPKTHLPLETKSRTLAWRILLRGVELDILAWVNIGGVSSGNLPEGNLPDGMNSKIKSTQKKHAMFDRAQRHCLVWLDTLKGDSRSTSATNVLQDARQSATRRVIGSLEWDEALAINQSFTCISLGNAGAAELHEESQQPGTSQNEADKETPGNDYTFNNADLSSYSYIERNKIRARFRARVNRFGREAALAMPIDAQKTGRKRKGEEENVEFLRKKTRRGIVQQQADADDEAGVEEEEMIESELPKQIHLASARLPRLEQIGVSLETVISLLPKMTKDSLNLFNVKALKLINLILEKQRSKDWDYHIAGVGPDTLAILMELLHEHLRTILSSIVDIASSGVNVKGETRKLVSAADVKAALLLSKTDHSVFKENGKGLESSVALDLFRSDPPQLYHYDSNKMQELQVQLHGLKTFRSALPSQSNQRHNSTIADAVISASDTFSIPVLSTYAPHSENATAMGDEPVMDISSSSEESSVYNDSEEERQVQLQKEHSRGLPRESNWIDGRVREYNERREIEDVNVWEQMDKRDEVKAARCEKRLWASLGLQSKEPRRLGDNGENNIQAASGDDLMATDSSDGEEDDDEGEETE